MFMNKRFSGKLIICIVTNLLFVNFSYASNTSETHIFEGELTFNKELPVDLSTGTSEHPELVNIKSINFESIYTNAWAVSINIGWLPVIDSSWKIRTELLDRGGNILRKSRDDQTLITCKASESNEQTMQYAQVNMDSMLFQGRRHVTSFRITLEPAENPFVKEGGVRR